jgi:MFS transporter, DHA1 family, inner membrane transport protein
MSGLVVRPLMAVAAGERREAGRWPTILLVLGAGIVSAFQVGKAPAALEAVRADLGLDLAAGSWLLSAFAVVGALAGIAIGVGVDHVGARRMAVGGLLLQAASSALGAVAGDAALLLATRIAEGLGFLAAVVAAPALVVAVARPDDRSRAIAAWGTFMPVGITMVLLAAPLIGSLGWRGFWLANAAILAGYALLLAMGTRGLVSAAAPRRILADVGGVLAGRGPWLLAGLFAAFTTCYFALIGFLPTILGERLAVGPAAASLLTAAAVVFNVAGNLGCGWLLARGVSRTLLLLVGFAIMPVCGFAIFGDGVPGPAAYALCLVFSAVSGLVPVALFDAVPGQAPRPELIGATIGLLMQGNNLGLLVGPVAAGALAAAYDWPSVGLFVAAVTVAATGLILALRRRPA